MRRALAVASCLFVACGPAEVEGPPPAPVPPTPVATIAPPPPAPPPMSRADWNRIAVRLNQPLFWVADANGNGTPEPGEVVRLLFYPSSFKPLPEGAYDSIKHYDPEAGLAGLPADEVARRRLVLSDLDQGAPTLVSNVTAVALPTAKVLGQILPAAFAIDDLKAIMSGAKALASRVPADDTASQSLFRRDWGPKCAGAKTVGNPACSAIPGAPKPIADAYPASLQADPDFCAKLEKHPDHKKLLDPFTVVREKNGKLVAVPYSEAYAEPMGKIAVILDHAAQGIDEPAEGPLRKYLAAAAKSFRTNDWGPADEAWSKMNAQNSHYYVRIGPDEVLSDPCSQKAQFHLTFAKIDDGSLEWQTKLAPLEQEMEKLLAGLAGAPYKPRHVAFHLPDFIQIVLNAGDDRSPVGATAGESLPNWGKVESEGRGRTVVMTNIGTDPDSVATSKKRLESLVDASVMKEWSDAPEPALLGTILHEATHNLGPTYTYVLNGKKPNAAFGGGLSAMLEELKAETGALYFFGWAAKKGLITQDFAQQGYVAWLAWSLRHIANGVHSGSDDQPYSQLAAIEVGFLLDEGALAWSDTAQAANGSDHGAFSIFPDKLGPAIEKLMTRVMQVKANNDKAGADALVARYVDGPVVPQKAIAERSLRFPQSTYVYAAFP